MPRLAGRVALITGAASGIGAACARRFAEEGARLVGFDSSGEGLEDWRRASELADGALLLRGDVRALGELESAVKETVQRFGRLDVLVNSAGVASGGPVHLLPIEEWDRVIDINLKGTFLASRSVLPQMLAQGSGSIVNLASVEGIEGIEAGGAYNASKGGVMLLTRSMAIDYARKGIRVNAICPGFVETPLLAGVLGAPELAETRARIRDAHQLGRLGRADEIANAALFLACDESSFVTGHALVVDGGYTAGHRFGISKLMGLE